MAAFEWREVLGVEFTPEEAREASDFVEVLRNFGMEPADAYKLFSEDNQLTPAKRLVFAMKVGIDDATVLLLCDSDSRIRAVVDARLKEYRKEQNGGIIL